MKTILVVDDTRDCREPLARLLKLAGYQPTTAISGLDALAQLQTDRPDLILLDLMMPDMDGVSFLRELRQSDLFKDLPVIVLTALSNGPMVTEAKKLGVNGTLLKANFSVDDLLHVIEGVIPDDPHRNNT